MKIAHAALVAGALLLAGCTRGYRGPANSAAARRQPIAALTYDAVDQLVASASLDPNTTLLVASVADIDDLTQTGGLGRLISEEAATRLIQLGYRVPEVRLSDTLHVRNGGEFMLSSNIAELHRLHGADYIVVGTYDEVGKATHINLRLVRLADGVPVAATEFAVPRSVALPAQVYSATNPLP